MVAGDVADEGAVGHEGYMTNQEHLDILTQRMEEARIALEVLHILHRDLANWI